MIGSQDAKTPQTGPRLVKPVPPLNISWIFFIYLIIDFFFLLDLKVRGGQSYASPVSPRHSLLVSPTVFIDALDKVATASVYFFYALVLLCGYYLLFSRRSTGPPNLLALPSLRLLIIWHTDHLLSTRNQIYSFLNTEHTQSNLFIPKYNQPKAPLLSLCYL